jgi:hypothetical protein
LRKLTGAFEITAPVASEMVPVTVASTVWLNPTEVVTKKATKRKRIHECLLTIGGEVIITMPEGKGPPRKKGDAGR